MDIKKYLLEKKEIVDLALERYGPKKVESPTPLQSAIRHSLYAGGKRVRPILSIASFEAVGGKGEGILPFACALEMIHTYSLIHDDLPAMDNDDYRRGKPTCHKLFGEAIGILAGDALLTEAFALMTDRSIQTTPLYGEGFILDIIHEVAQSAGVSGMVGGQELDIESEGKDVDLPTLHYIHTHKTGALILTSIRIGVRLGMAGRGTGLALPREEILRAYTCFGEKVGLAFQITDDILNVEGNADLLGKKTGGDLHRRKATYPSLMGLEESKRRAKELVEGAIDALSPFGTEADPLREIARFMIAREY